MPARGSGTRDHSSEQRRGVRSFLSNESGLETVEYAILAGLIVSGVVLWMTASGNGVQEQYSNMKTERGA